MSSFSKLSVASPSSQLILQPFRSFTYVAVHSPTILSLLLRHRIFTYVTWRAARNERSSFSKLSVALPTSQLIFQPFPRFIYVTAHSPTLPFLHLRRSSFSNHSFASPTSQALHFRHLTSRHVYAAMACGEYLSG